MKMLIAFYSQMVLAKQQACEVYRAPELSLVL